MDCAFHEIFLSGASRTVKGRCISRIGGIRAPAWADREGLREPVDLLFKSQYFLEFEADTLKCPASRQRKRGSAVRAAKTMAGKMTDDEIAAIESEIEQLRQEHRDLDSAIEALQGLGSSDQLQLQRLKKRKLVLRDRISQLEDMLTPDIIA